MYSWKEENISSQFRLSLRAFSLASYRTCFHARFIPESFYHGDKFSSARHARTLHRSPRVLGNPLPHRAYIESVSAVLHTRKKSQIGMPRSAIITLVYRMIYQARSYRSPAHSETSGVEAKVGEEARGSAAVTNCRSTGRVRERDTSVYAYICFRANTLYNSYGADDLGECHERESVARKGKR